MIYLGSVVVNNELVQIHVSGQDARYVCTNPVGNVNVFGTRLKSNLPVRIGALRYLLEAAPPASNFHACHGEPSFFEDWQECTNACTMMLED